MTKDWFRVSYSRIKEWTTCRWRYGLSYEQYLRPKISIRKALDMGDLWHRVMEVLYAPATYPANLKKDPDAIMDQADIPKSLHPVLGDVRGFLATYLEAIRFGTLIEPQRILLAEWPFSVPIDPVEIDARARRAGYHGGVLPGSIAFIGVIDLVVQHGTKTRPRLAIWDHKLQGNAPSNNSTSYMELTYPQLPLYCMASSQLGRSIREATLSVFAHRRGSNNVLRYPIAFTEEQMDAWQNWLYGVITDILISKERPKALGSLYCDWCDWASICQMHMQRSQSLEDVLAEHASKSEYAPRHTEWNKEFPSSLRKA